MRHSIVVRTLWDQRLRLLLQQLGFVAVALIYGSFSAGVRNPQMQAALENAPPDLITRFGFSDIASPAGYLESSVYAIAALLLIIFTVGQGAQAIAGDEERGLLELLLAGPLSRTAFYLQRYGALQISVALNGLTIFAATLAINQPADLHLPTANLAAMALHFSLLGSVLASVSFAVGAASGRAGLSIAVGSIVGMGGYIANNLAPQVEALAWLQKLSPFYYFAGSAPLRNGIQPLHCAILAAAALSTALLAWPLFTRRSIGVK